MSNNKLNDENKKLLEESEQLLNKAIGLLGERSRMKVEAYNSLAMNKVFSDKPEEAIAHLDEALKLAPDNQPILRNKLIAAFQAKNLQIVLETMEKIEKQDETVFCIKVWALFGQGKNDEAESQLKKRIGEEPRLENSTLKILTEMLIDENQNNLALEVINFGLGNENDLGLMAMQAKVLYKLGKTIEARNIVINATKLAELKTDIHDLKILAKAAHGFGLLNEAGFLYNTVYEKDKKITPLYLDVLSRSGKEDEAFQLARQAKEENDGKAIPGISEYEASALLNIGDFAQAEKLFAELLSIKPKEEIYFINLQLVRFRKGERKEAVNSLIESANKFQDRPEVLFMIAEMASLTERNIDALELAYKGLVKGFKSPDIQRRYIGLFFKIEKSEEIRRVLNAPKIIQEDTAVHLEDDRGEKRWIQLAPANEQDNRDFVWKSDEENAGWLIGHAVGDEVGSKQSSLDLKYKILELQSKYVRAFQNVLTDFEHRFPGTHGVHSVPVPDGDISKILEVIDARQKDFDEIMKLYNKKNIPLGAIGKFFGKNATDAYFSLLGNNLIYVSSGNIDEREIAIKNIDSEESNWILDITILNTFSLLNMLDLLPKINNRLAVSMLAFEELKRRYEEEIHSPPRAMTLSKDGDKYTRTVYDEETAKSASNLFKNQIEFIEKYCKVIPATGALEKKIPDPKRLREALGDSQFGSLILGIDSAGQGILLADDYALLRIANIDYKIKGVWGQVVLNQAREKNIITSLEYAECVIKMMKYGYYFVWINDEVIWDLLEKDFAKISEDAKIALEHLGKEDVTEDTAINISSTLIKRLWTNAMTVERRYEIFDAIVESLVAQRSPGMVLKKLENNLRSQLTLVPHYLDDVTKRITFLKQIHLWP